MGIASRLNGAIIMTEEIVTQLIITMNYTSIGSDYCIAVKTGFVTDDTFTWSRISINCDHGCVDGENRSPLLSIQISSIVFLKVHFLFVFVNNSSLD